VSNHPAETIPEIRTSAEKVDTPPSQLNRIDPPNLVQLTEFTREQFDSPVSPAGPQLVLPQSAVGETFEIIDQPVSEAPEHSPSQSSETLTRVDREQASGTVLPWGPSTPTPEMTAVAQRAEEVARRGYELAQRGGLYSAQARFTESLRIIAEALDAQRNTMAHTKSLSAGLRALQEVDDFVPRGTKIESSMNMPLIVDAHRTPVLKEQPLDGVTPLVAQRSYLTYAQEQLAMAGGDQSVASLALHGLGKVCTTPAQMHGPRTQIAEAKAVVYFQAAVLIEPRNFMSANELGVLLARFGRLNDARQALEQAVAASNSPTTWRNLAVVNERLGDPQKAMLCRQRSDTAITQSRQTQTNNTGSQHPVRWVDPETFAQSNTMVPDTTPPAAKTATEGTKPATSTAAKPEAKPSGWKWPWQ
jgi:tetratricopeptide (TPR) repeat protein